MDKLQAYYDTDIFKISNNKYLAVSNRENLDKFLKYLIGV